MYRHPHLHIIVRAVRVQALSRRSLSNSTWSSFPPFRRLGTYRIRSPNSNHLLGNTPILQHFCPSLSQTYQRVCQPSDIFRHRTSSAPVRHLNETCSNLPTLYNRPGHF